MVEESSGLRRCILYYPTISIPTGTWLRQSLLYWDQIGSIVPQSHEGQALVPYSPDIQYLKEEGQFRPFVPDHCILQQGYEKRQELEQEFIALVESPSFQSMLLPLSRRNLASRIHEDKISHALIEYLERSGLATRAPAGNERWYAFENHTALLYMAILAKHIADGDVQSTVTGTDLEVYENLIFGAMNNSEGVACLATNLAKALPVPRNDVPLADIIEFKSRRRNELLHFRQELDKLQSEIKKCERKADVHQVLLEFKEKAEGALADLDALLVDSRIATLAGSLKTLIKLDSPTLLVALGAAIGQATRVTDIPLAWTITGVGVIGAVEISAYLTDKRNEKRATLRQEPFSYLAYASAEGFV